MNAKLTIICLLFIPVVLFSQNNDESNAYRAPLSNAIQLYHLNNPDQAPIYSGPQYIRFPFPIVQGQAFYKQDKLETGSLIYDNVLYDSVQLMHDEIRDQLIISDFHHTTLVLLYSKKITWFNIFQQNFVRLDKDSAQGITADMGFCQRLFDGKTKVYKKEIKSITTRAENSQSLSRYIVADSHYYISYNHKFYEVNNSKSLLAAFADRKKDLSQYLRSNRLRFRKNKDNVIVKAAAFIEQTKQ